MRATGPRGILAMTEARSAAGDAQAVHDNTERAATFSKYFHSAFAKELDRIPASHKDEGVLSRPLVTKKDVKQHLLITSATENFLNKQSQIKRHQHKKHD